MKLTIVRLSVLALAMVGFTASTITAHSQKHGQQIAAFGQTVPTPYCSYWDPNCCGMH